MNEPERKEADAREAYLPAASVSAPGGAISRVSIPVRLVICRKQWLVKHAVKQHIRDIPNEINKVIDS